MSYDLYFWKQRTPSLTPPADTWSKIDAGAPPDFVERLASASFVEGIKSAFPGIVENKTTNPAVPVQLICEPSDGGCFIVTWSDHMLTVEAHGVETHHFNTLIDIAHSVGAALYDPQTDVRYEG